MTRALRRVDLRPVRRVPASSQLAYRRGDAELEICRWVEDEGVPDDWLASRSGCRARRGVVDQCVPGRSWPWHGTG